MLIYCNGDSFMAGEGLADEETLPGYRAGSYTNQVAYHQWRYQLVISSKPLQVELQNREKEKSYPAQLGKLLDATVINSAQRSASNGLILNSTLLDLLALDTTPDVVIIHVTSSSRNTIFDASDINSLSRSVLLNWPTSDYKIEYLRKGLTLVHSAIDDEIRRLFEISMINHVVHSITGKCPILVVTSDILSEVNTHLPTSQLTTQQELLINASRIKLIPESLIECNIHPQEQLPCGHFPQHISDQFAANIAQHINDNYIKT